MQKNTKVRLLCFFLIFVKAAIFLVVLSHAGVARASSYPGLPEDPGGPPIPGTDRFIHLAYQILNFMSTLGILVVVIFLTYTGYKIVASQDPRARAEAIHSLVPLAIGAFVAFGARWIALFIKGFAESI